MSEDLVWLKGEARNTCNLYAERLRLTYLFLLNEKVYPKF